MPEDAALLELVRLLAELKAIAESLRSTAARLAAVKELIGRRTDDAAEITRSVLAELERARRRGWEGESIP